MNDPESPGYGKIGRSKSGSIKMLIVALFAAQISEVRLLSACNTKKQDQ
jgi:hypothetical protein